MKMNMIDDPKTYQLKPLFIPFKCPNCLGHTTVSYGKQICPTCKGLGFIKVPLEDDEYENTITK
jgi:hypothetical protein